MSSDIFFSSELSGSFEDEALSLLEEVIHPLMKMMTNISAIGVR